MIQVGTVIIPILQLRKLRPTKVTLLIQGHIEISGGVEI